MEFQFYFLLMFLRKQQRVALLPKVRDLEEAPGFHLGQAQLSETFGE